MSTKSPRLFFLFSIIGLLGPAIRLSAAQVIAFQISGSRDLSDLSSSAVSMAGDPPESQRNGRIESEALSATGDSVRVSDLVTIPPVSFEIPVPTLLAAIRGAAGADGYWFSTIAAEWGNPSLRKVSEKEWNCLKIESASDHVPLVVGSHYWNLYRMSDPATTIDQLTLPRPGRPGDPIFGHDFFHVVGDNGFQMKR